MDHEKGLGVVLLAAAALAAPFPSPRASAQGADAGDVLRAEFKEEIADLETRMAELDEQYLQALKRFEKRAKERGNLDVLLAIRNEQEGFRSGPTEGVGSSARLRELRGIYEEQRDERLESIGRHRDMVQFSASHGGYAVLDEDGEVETRSRWSSDRIVNLPDLPPVQHVRVNWSAVICQLEDGTWRSFGEHCRELHQRVPELGKRPDLDLSTWSTNGVLTWIE